MHYRNGREAKNGDKVVQLNGQGAVTGVGVLHDAKGDGGDHCNGLIAPTVYLASRARACATACTPMTSQRSWPRRASRSDPTASEPQPGTSV